MSELFSGVNLMMQHDLNAFTNSHHDNVAKSGQSVKGHQIDRSTNIYGIQNESIIYPLLTKNQIGIDVDHSVRDAALMNNSISQLKCEINNSIIDVIKKNRYNNCRYGVSKDNNKRDYDLDESIENQVDAYVKFMLLKIQILMIKKGPRETFKFITIFENYHYSLMAFKQALTIVSYKNGLPHSSISEIIKINKQGDLTSLRLPSRVIDGGFDHPDDWININVRNQNHTEVIQELSVQHRSHEFKGYSLICDLGMQKINPNTNSKIYIPGFNRVW